MIEIILFILLAVLDRLRETTIFESWYKKLPKWMQGKWWKSDDSSELRYFYFFNLKIYLHPIFWDGYHFTKNLSILLLLIYVLYKVDIIIALSCAIAWTTIQWLLNGED